MSRSWLFLVAAGLLLAAGFGYLALAASGACDTSCPSDTALLSYKLLSYGGTVSFVALTLWLVMKRR